MISYFLYVAGFFSVILLYKIDAHTIIKENTLNKYSRWKKLNKLVATQYKRKYLIIYHSICMIFTSLWIAFLLYINDSVKKIDHKTYEVSYIINGKYYKMLIKPDRGPLPVLLVYDDKENDMTNKFLPYLGAKNDFHGFKITPQFFGVDKLSLETSNGESLVFKDNEMITLKKNS